MSDKIKKKIAGLIDQTLLKPNSSNQEYLTLCRDAMKWGFRTVCVEPYFVDQCVQHLEGTSTEVCTVIDFPKGLGDIERNLDDVEMVINEGAMEIDMVMDIDSFRLKKYDKVLTGIYSIVEAAAGRVVKVIIETCHWNDDEIKIACEIIKEAKAQFVKTSTGFSNNGAKVSQVKVIRQTVGDLFGVKASGGINSFNDAIKMIEAGANRIGTSSGVKIIEGINAD